MLSLGLELSLCLDITTSQTIRQNQITQVEAALETATGFRRFVLLWTQQFLRRSVVVIESESVRAQDTLTQLEAEAASLTEQAAAAQAICDAPVTPPQPPANDNIAGLTFLHADHLGRPAFATDTSGEIVWDGGITTPFGVQLETLGALTQNLMFPGQYEDLDTEGAGVTLSHNWHRTYDPTLGRYLQSDPIGLAGGLNRYAYVGGNPMNWVDPEGEAIVDFIPNGRSIIEGLARYNSSLSDYYYSHLYRNVNNIDLPCHPPKNGEWKELVGWGKVGFHRFPTTSNPFSNFGNRKFVSNDGRREVIFDSSGRRVSHRTNAGTYNRASPTDDPKGHVKLDVVPYFIFGNGPSLLNNDCSCNIPTLRGSSTL